MVPHVIKAGYCDIYRESRAVKYGAVILKLLVNTPLLGPAFPVLTTEGVFNTAAVGVFNTAALGVLNTAAVGVFNTAAEGVFNTAAAGVFNTAAVGAFNTAVGVSTLQCCRCVEHYRIGVLHGTYTSGIHYLLVPGNSSGTPEAKRHNNGEHTARKFFWDSRGEKAQQWRTHSIL